MFILVPKTFPVHERTTVPILKIKQVLYILLCWWVLLANNEGFKPYLMLDNI